MPRKGENIYKRKDGRWEGRYIKARSKTGKAVYGYVYAPTYKEAKRKRSQAIINIEANQTTICKVPETTMPTCQNAILGFCCVFLRECGLVKSVR